MLRSLSSSTNHLRWCRFLVTVISLVRRGFLRRFPVWFACRFLSQIGYFDVEWVPPWILSVSSMVSVFPNPYFLAFYFFPAISPPTPTAVTLPYLFNTNPCDFWFHIIFSLQITPSMSLISSVNLPHSMANLHAHGEGEFAIPVELCDAATRATQFSLLIRPANPRRQNLRAMTRFFPRLWGMDNIVTGRVAAHGRIQFLFPSNEALQLVYRRGPWSFNEWMVAMEPWHPQIPEESPTQINFWIQIRGVPLQFSTAPMFAHIANTMGPILESDIADAVGGNLEFARVCIPWSLDRPLLFQRRFNFGGESVDVSFRFERLRIYCFRCNSLRHDVSECTEPDQDDDVAMHQDPPPPPEVNNQIGDIVPIPHMHNNPFPAPLPPAVALVGPPQVLALPPPPQNPTLLPSATIEIDGVRMSIADLRTMYHTYTAVSDCTEAEARRRRLLLAMENADPLVIEAVTRPLPSPSTNQTKRRKIEPDTSSTASSSKSNNGGAAGPAPPQ